MPSFANIEILGHVGREPEQRHSQQGQMLVSFSVAVNPPGKRQPDGSYIDSETDWYRITCFGRTAERAVELTKGQVVHVRGSFRTDRWTAQDGTARTNLDIVADRVTNLAPRRTETFDDHDLERTKRDAATSHGNATLEDLPF